MISQAYIWTERLLIGMSVVAILSQLSGTMVGYNFPLALWGLFAINVQNARIILSFLSLLAFSFIIDIAWAGTWGNMIDMALKHASANKTLNADGFGLVMLCFIIMIKPIILYFGRFVFYQSGGLPDARIVGPAFPAGSAAAAANAGGDEENAPAGDESYHHLATGKSPYNDPAAETAYGDVTQSPYGAQASAYGVPADGVESSYHSH